MTEITSISVLLTEIGKTPIPARRQHLRRWFRGHARSDWKLVPGIYRLKESSNEEELLTTERHLSQDFRIMSAGLRKGGEDDVDLYFLQQHYRMPTRLLDWSADPLAALYFATEHEPTADGKLFFMDSYMLSVNQQAEETFEGVATSRNEEVRKAIQIITNWHKRKFPPYIIPIRPDHADQRISRQRGYFTFHTPEARELTNDTNSTLRAYKIPAAAKVRIKKELELAGVNQFTVFGDLDHLAEWLKSVHCKQ
ncbi:FRG domain-containing protein [Hyphomicrobium sp.]|uniref:FRG domain-containing protein n=1 Tax=Hyphomicrobium sp. TaxID=82 RepID=UPI001D9AC6C2|nr:FRG domain-containing protein [Hyphomicrobium sp.]MBY0561008.1 FRG domain-containing protein [Hyphomicrobium sp.]